MRREIIFDDLMEKIPNKYRLTVIAGKRAREIYSGETSYLPHEAKYRDWETS